MLLYIWYYYITGTTQSEYLVQVFSLLFIVRNYWVNRLHIAINSFPKHCDMSETAK